MLRLEFFWWAGDFGEGYLAFVVLKMGDLVEAPIKIAPWQAGNSTNAK
jgi:hypothetical protein